LLRFNICKHGIRFGQVPTIDGPLCLRFQSSDVRTISRLDCDVGICREDDPIGG
jgi:hypothetical protein